MQSVIVIINLGRKEMQFSVRVGGKIVMQGWMEVTSEEKFNNNYFKDRNLKNEGIFVVFHREIYFFNGNKKIFPGKIES